MAKVAKAKASEKSETEDFTLDLIEALNKERGEIVAYNLAVDQSPTHVKRWISTGIKSLDYICGNRRNGGLPEGRIIEIFGAPSLGKSHVAAQICRQVQKIGGIAVYIDSETATSVENLNALGIDIRQRFVYVNEHCTENILSIAESTILKARALKKDVPICIVWDSVAASSPKAELEGEYDKETVGLQARAISKGMRKITGVLGDQNVLFVILNQTRMKIGCIAPETMITVRRKVEHAD
jgi:recombination protein RecA